MILVSTPPSVVVGCDVGKKTIVVYQSDGGEPRTLANEPASLAAWAAGLPEGALVVCEATGGYEAGLLEAVAAAGIAVHRADARKVKAFIRSLGTLGKSDAIDARALARYGRERHASLAHFLPRDAARHRLRGLVAARRELVATRVAYANRLKAPDAIAAAPHYQAVIDCLKAEIAHLDRQINTLIRKDKMLSAAVAALRAIAGLGPVTAAALLALMPELGTLSRRQAAALAGLAPHPRQSGERDRYRRVRGGRPDVKSALFMAALAATRTAGPLAQTYNRLIANGKKPLVALTAVMRKIVVIANAKLRDIDKQTQQLS